MGNEQIKYIFEFEGLEKKVELFALHYNQAIQYIKGNPYLSNKIITNIQCHRCIKYFTEKNVLNGDSVWVGFDNSPDGWVNKNIFLNSKY